MKRHAIFGAGNLGLDLHHELRRQLKVDASLFSLVNGFDVRDLGAVERVVARGRFDCLWYCVGAGGEEVREARVNEPETRYVLSTVPGVISELAPPETALVFFSSLDAAHDETTHDPRRMCLHPRSELAQMRIDLERFIFQRQRPRTAVVRLGSLYGLHKPEQTFPGQVLKHYGFGPRLPESIKLPHNGTTPTPTLWAAALLISRLDLLFDEQGPKTSHLAPEGQVGYRDWAAFVLDGLRPASVFKRAPWFNPELPLFGGLGCSLSDARYARGSHWLEVWRTYFDQRRFTPIEYRPQLAALAAPSREREAQA